MQPSDLAPVRAAAGLRLAVLAILLAAIGPLATDVYLPSLPGIAADLDSSAALAQLTIGVFVAGFAVMMLLCGPLADRYGRRPVVLAGMGLFVLASAACALSPTIELLLAARFVQAAGASVGPVLGRTIVRDVYGPKDAGRVLGYMASAIALAPLVAPFIGGWLEALLGWRANFWFLALYGAALVVWLGRHLPETRPADAVAALRPLALLRGYGWILRHRAFTGYMLAVGLGFGALFTWITNSAFVVIGFFGVAPEHFGWAFGAVILGYMVGGISGSRAGMRLGPAGSTALGARLQALAGLGLLAQGVAGWAGGLPLLVGLMALSFLGAGVVISQATAGALAPFPERAGAAAALVGSMQMSIGVLVNLLSSAWFDGTPWPMVLLNTLCALLALAAFWCLVRPRRG
jgi:DHA1 family bicyclomycin/chloramphenicol resistance-like MFS transporter